MRQIEPSGTNVFPSTRSQEPADQRNVRRPSHMMRRKCVILLVGATLAVLVGMALGYYHLILDWDGRPFCHKQINLAFRIWMKDRGTHLFPNVDGVGRDSLA